MKRISMAAVAAMVAMVAVVLTLPTPSVGGEQAKAKVGEMAPDFTLPAIGGGEQVKLSDFRDDKIVVLTFHSTECPWNYMRPTAGYERVLYPMAEAYADQDVVFLAINSNRNESAESLESYIEKHQTPYAILKDEGNQVADQYGAKTTPHFYVIDKQGKLRYMGGYEAVPGNPEQCGEMDEQYLKPVIDAVISGSEPPYTETKPKGCGIKRVS